MALTRELKDLYDKNFKFLKKETEKTSKNREIVYALRYVGST